MLQQYKVFHGKHRKYILEKATFKLIKRSLEFFRKGNEHVKLIEWNAPN